MPSSSAINSAQDPLVCLDARMVHHSGIGTHIRGLAEGLHALRTESEPGDPSAPPPLAFLGDPELLGRYPFFRDAGPIHAWRAPIYSAAEQVAMPRVSRAAAWHFPHYSVPQILRPRRPFAVTIHDLIHLLFPEVAGSRAKRMAGRLLMESAVRRARAVLTVSECSRRDIARVLRVPEERILITPNAVHPSFQPVAPGEVGALRRTLGLPARYLLAVGIRKPHKNLEFLIETFLRWKKSRASGAGGELHLVLCGLRGEDQAALARLAAERGGGEGEKAAVRFTPFLEHGQLPALYQGAEALVFPSLYEGFGLPVLEAQRIGVPVLATSASSVPEVGGEGALYFDPRSDEELMSRLDEFYDGGEELRRRLVTAGHANESRYCWQATARMVAGVYGSLLGI